MEKTNMPNKGLLRQQEARIFFNATAKERLLTFSLLFVLFFWQAALSADVNDIIRNVQKTYDRMDNFSAVFRQIDTFKLTGSRTETIGKIYIKNGDKYRFESEDQVIVTDGKTVWTYNALSKQLLIDRVRKNSGALLPRDLLFKYPKTHYATLLGEEKKNGRSFYLVRLDPKEGVRGYIKSIRLHIEKKSWLIDEIETTDPNGNTSLFEISKINRKTKLADTLFTYQPPKGAEVVDMRK